MLKGNETLLLIGGVRLASQRSLSIKRQTDTIEVCSPVDGAAKRFVPSTTSWNVQAGGLYAKEADADRLREIWRGYQRGKSAPLPVSIQTATRVETGEAILTDLQETGNLNQLVEFSIQLLGSGVLDTLGDSVTFLRGIEGKLLNVVGCNLEIYDLEEQTIYYADIHVASTKTLRMTQAEAWCVVPGSWSYYLADVEYNDQYGNINANAIAKRNGEGSVVLTPDDYVVMVGSHSVTPKGFIK